VALILAGRVSFDIDIGVNIPITGQTFVVLLIGYFLNIKSIIILYVLYYLGGATGMPFFADSAGGLSHLTGKSGGYLYSFILASLLFSHYKKSFSPVTGFAGALVATALILLVGMLHLSYFIGLSKAWTYGVLPFILGGIVKATAAIGCIYVYRKLK